MHLFSQQPYWLMKDGIINSYPSLTRDISTDVAIMGAGISGALVAYYLRNSGFSVTVLDRRHVGMGSTAASTAFLQYEIDTPLHKLCGYVGEENAVRSYELCRQAIYIIENICKLLKPDFDFHIRPSLQYATYQKHMNDLQKEYELRKKHGFDVAWLAPADIQDKFGITAPGAILSEDGGEVDAYILAHALIAAVHKQGHTVHNNTNIVNTEQRERGVVLHTEAGYKVKAKKLIVACGYESLKYVPKKIADIHTTYALVSEPLADIKGWYKSSLVWETATPYLYFRRVNGDRILVGGKDDNYHHPNMLPSVIRNKTAMLETAFGKRMRHIPLKADFSWSGAFAVTKDGLPYIGQVPGIRNTYFALGFGGNGITFSVIAADILRDELCGRKNADRELFTFNR